MESLLILRDTFHLLEDCGCGYVLKEGMLHFSRVTIPGLEVLNSSPLLSHELCGPGAWTELIVTMVSALHSVWSSAGKSGWLGLQSAGGITHESGSRQMDWAGRDIKSQVGLLMPESLCVFSMWPGFSCNVEASR